MKKEKFKDLFKWQSIIYLKIRLLLIKTRSKFDFHANVINLIVCMKVQVENIFTALESMINDIRAVQVTG